ncbi:MAG TPA: hypothetical protein VFU81_22420, partial [Thermomicrobiales bacterium]|nr:hypothetical protein [Thermomicrobiales bacterium]
MIRAARQLLGRLFLLCSACTLLGAIVPPAFAAGANVTAPALAGVPAATAPALDYGLPDGHFFTQANGSPLGKSATGFLLADDGGIGLWT